MLQSGLMARVPYPKKRKILEVAISCTSSTHLHLIALLSLKANKKLFLFPFS